MALEIMAAGYTMPVAATAKKEGTKFGNYFTEELAAAVTTMEIGQIVAFPKPTGVKQTIPPAEMAKKTAYYVNRHVANKTEPRVKAFNFGWDESRNAIMVQRVADAENKEYIAPVAATTEGVESTAAESKAA